MARKSISGGQELAQAIRDRRLDLELTIEEAAKRAGVGTKTWSRFVRTNVREFVGLWNGAPCRGLWKTQKRSISWKI